MIIAIASLVTLLLLAHLIGLCHFFRNLSGQSWVISILWHGMSVAVYTPWFGWSYNVHPNRISQLFHHLTGTHRYCYGQCEVRRD
jgi:hypothetical protein